MFLHNALRKYSIGVYFLLAYGLAWGCVFGLAWPVVSTGGEISAGLMILMILTMFCGPALSSLLLTGLETGRSGLTNLYTRWIKRPIKIGWVALAVLTVPVLNLAVLLSLTTWVSPVFSPQFKWEGMLVGLGAGFFEEIGWTGFATPHLRQRFGVWSTGLILGLLWGIWHFAADFLGRWAPYQDLWLPNFLAFVAAVAAYRVLMVWVHERTGSLLLAQLMHAFYTGTLYLLGPTLTPAQDLLANWIFAVAMVLLTAGTALRFARNR